MAKREKATDSTVTSALRHSPAFLRRSVELSQGVALGRYLVVRILGAGGMGRVYLAYDPQLDRRVAVKLLRDSRQEPAHRARFIREAQAMARLSHPNVVSVLDVGSVNEQDFVAMEYVKGETLSSWLQRRSRRWPEVLKVFLAAGRGLAAAHDAGVVHRDFKPSNVLVGRDERVRVTDFGIARMVAPGQDRGSAIYDAVALGGPDVIAGSATCTEQPAGTRATVTKPADPELTRSGVVVGTPKYMAPEQHAGTVPDPRTDQFSFCVALYEALYHDHPFGGQTSAKLAAVITPTRNPRRVPPGVRKVLLRGLSATRGDRYPTMAALMADLEGGPKRRRRRTILAIVAAAIVAAGLLASLLYSATRAGQPCADAQRHLAGIWNDEVKLAIRQAFVATPTPYAADTWNRVETALDDHARSWVEMRAAACVSTHVEKLQSIEVLNLRIGCLDDKRERMRALVEVFGKADEVVVANAVMAVSHLELDSCANHEALTMRVKPPAAALRRRIDAVKEQLAQVDALRVAGKLDRALTIATAATATARAIDYRPLTGTAALALGRVHSGLEHGVAAEAALRDAAWAAEASGDDATAADAWIALVYVLRFNHTDYSRAAAAARHADAVVTRLGDDRRRVALLDELGGLSVQRGHFDAAVDHFELSIELAERSPGDHQGVANTLVALSNALSFLGRSKQALAHLDRALAVSRRLLGTDHPRVTRLYHSMGLALSAHGDYEDAASYLEQARRRWSESLGELHPSVGHANLNLGNTYFERGQFEQAAAHAEAAKKIWAQALGNDHFHTLLANTNQGEALAAWGRCDQAREILLPTLSLFEKEAETRDHIAVAYLLTALGQCDLASGDHATAVARLERALVIRSANPEDPAKLARTQFLLARALWQTGDQRRAVALANTVRAAYAAGGTRCAGKAAEVELWQRTHALPRAAPPD